MVIHSRRLPAAPVESATDQVRALSAARDAATAGLQGAACNTSERAIIWPVRSHADQA